jgi:hypothetical protein
MNRQKKKKEKRKKKKETRQETLKDPTETLQRDRAEGRNTASGLNQFGGKRSKVTQLERESGGVDLWGTPNQRNLFPR